MLDLGAENGNGQRHSFFTPQCCRYQPAQFKPSLTFFLSMKYFHICQWFLAGRELFMKKLWGVANPHHVDADPDLDPSDHYDAYPDPDPSFQIKAQNLEKVLTFYTFWLGICKLTRIRILIQLIIFMRIRILPFNLMRIYSDPDPQHCKTGWKSWA